MATFLPFKTSFAAIALKSANFSYEALSPDASLPGRCLCSVRSVLCVPSAWNGADADPSEADADPSVPVRGSLLLPRCTCECGSTCKLQLSPKKPALPSAMHRLGSSHVPRWTTPWGGGCIGGVTEWVWLARPCGRWFSARWAEGRCGAGVSPSWSVFPARRVSHSSLAPGPLL